jgi:hypothetical protein
MGKLKQAAIEQQESIEYFEDVGDNYLTMARIMGREWRDYQVKNVWGKSYTGHTEIAIKSAYEAGFMAGFSGRYFEQNDK